MNLKQKQLNKHKLIATSLFVLMMIIYISTLFISKYNNGIWIGYTKAFAEAGMVGALADWFAVTALFKYPLGIKIPHTNLINNNKDALGENLGGAMFVQEIENYNSYPQVYRMAKASAVAMEAADEVAVSTVDFKKIKYESKVKVIFEIKP